MPDDPDDPATLDWGEQTDTEIDDPITVTAAPVVPEADTDKFQSLDFAAGREEGFAEGVERVGEMVVSELLRAAFPGREASRWRYWVESEANKKAPRVKRG